MNDLARLVIEAWRSGLTEHEISRYLLVTEDKVQRIIEIEEATGDISESAKLVVVMDALADNIGMRLSEFAEVVGKKEPICQ